MIKKIKINKEKCIGCGYCTNLCPDVFELGSDGRSQIKKQVDLEKNKKCIQEAIESCPVQAIDK